MEPSPAPGPVEPAWTLPIPPILIAGLLTLAIFLLYLFLGTGSTLFDRDEPRFSRAAVEMVLTGNYLVPHFDGNLRPDKPILIYWLMSASIHLLDVSTLAVRLPSIIATALACFFCFLIGRSLFGPRTGLLAMPMLALSPLMMLDGAAAISDAVLLLTLTASFAIFIARLQPGLTLPWMLLMGLTLGLAQLAKGPVAIAVVIGGCAMMVWFLRRGPGQWASEPGAGSSTGTPLAAAGLPTGTRSAPTAPVAAIPQPAPDRRLWLKRQVIGLAVVLLMSTAIFLLWAIPADRATGGELARQGLGRHVGERMIQPQEGHGGANLPAYLAFLPFYLLVMGVGFAPWVVYLTPAWRWLASHRRRHPGFAVLTGWFLPTFILMTLVATKLPHYILPLWPALSVGCATWLIAAWQTNPTSPIPGTRLLRRTAGVTTPLALVAAIVVTVLVWGGATQAWFDRPDETWSMILADLAWPVTILFWTVATLSVAAWLLIRLSRVTESAVAMAMGMVAVVILLGGWLLPTLERFKPSPALAAVANQPEYRHLPIATFRFDEPSLRFYANRTEPSTRLLSEQEVIDWLAGEEPALLVTDRHLLLPLVERARQMHRAPSPKTLLMFTGFTTRSDQRFSYLLLVKRGGSSASDGPPPAQLPRPPAR